MFRFCGSFLFDMSLFLTKQQKTELLSELRLERNRKCADRIRIILLSNEGEPASQIAKYFFLHEGTVRNYQTRYEKGGLEGLIVDDQSGRMSYLSEKQQKELVLELESKVYPTTKSVVLYVKKEFGVVYTVNGMTALLHRLGFSYKKPKGVPGKADIEEQKAFIQKYQRIKEEDVLMYFADSTHPMLNPVISSGWIRKGSEFKIKTNSGRERVNINGAIEINSLSFVGRSCERVNKHSMRELLRAVRAKHPARDKKLYLILDNAPYNRAFQVRDLAKSLEIKLLYLPPFSPNLNPIERFWKFVKNKTMANNYFPDVKTFRKELMLFLRGVRKYKPELSTLITDNFHIIET